MALVWSHPIFQSNQNREDEVMLTRIFKLLVCPFLVLITMNLPVSAQGDPTFGYSLQLDVVYGQGRISPEGTELMRDLMMDVYTPTVAIEGLLPAVIYVHGGAFHRGGRRNPPYRDGGTVHSSPEDWARLLAASGYVVFVIEYRLAPQNPIPGFAPGEKNTVADLKSVIREEMLPAFARARAGMGLPVLEYTDETVRWMWNSYISAVEDAALALDFIVRHAKDFRIDPDRIAMGGHSAGAGITWSVGIGLKTPLKAIFPQSGAELVFDKDYIAARTDLPAILVLYSQFDDPPVLAVAPGMVGLLKKAKADYTLAWIPSAPHFYPYNTPSLADDGTRIALGDRVIRFLDKHLKK